MDIKALDIKKLTTIWECTAQNPVLKAKIEAEFIARQGNKKYSREYLYSINIIGKRTLTIHFIPLTDSYNRYGKTILIDLLLKEEEISDIQVTYSSKPPIRTYGIMSGKSWQVDLPKDKQVELAKVGFTCADIGLIEYD